MDCPDPVFLVEASPIVDVAARDDGKESAPYNAPTTLPPSAPISAQNGGPDGIKIIIPPRSSIPPSAPKTAPPKMPSRNPVNALLNLLKWMPFRQQPETFSVRGLDAL
jgi:hypothetical protein